MASSAPMTGVKNGKVPAQTSSEHKGPGAEFRQRIEELDKACAQMRQNLYVLRQLLAKK